MNRAAIRQGIRPDDFRRMTPREVQWRIDAVVEEQNRTLERTAQLACWLLSPLLGKVLRPTDLLKRPGLVRKDMDWEAWAKD